MSIIYTDFILSKKITIKKLGLTFRLLSKKEKTFLNEQISFVLKYKKDINNLYIKYKENAMESPEFTLDVLKLPSQKKDIILSGYCLIKKGFKFNSKSKINDILDHLIVIECNEDIVKEYVDKNSSKKFISNILSLYNIYENTIAANRMRTNSDYTFILEDNIFTENSELFYNDILMNIICSYPDNENDKKRYILKHVDLNEEYLKTLADFIEHLNKENIYKFVEIIDLLYSNSYTIQNRILNNVTIVESLIINENDNIQKSYILKGGMILKKYLKRESSSSNEAIKLLLNFVYNIRSDIIHGNYSKIEKDLNTINQKDKSIKELIGDTTGILSKREKAFQISYCISLFVVRCTIKYWIENPYKIQYLKNN